MKRIGLLLVGAAVVLAACATDPTESEEYKELEQQVQELEAQLADADQTRDRELAFLEQTIETLEALDARNREQNNEFIARWQEATGVQSPDDVNP